MLRFLILWAVQAVDLAALRRCLKRVENRTTAGPLRGIWLSTAPWPVRWLLQGWSGSVAGMWDLSYGPWRRVGVVGRRSALESIRFVQHSDYNAADCPWEPRAVMPRGVGVRRL